jgi:hypothetical protein
VFPEAATINHFTDSSKKCLQCGLKNFVDRKRCVRCKSDLSQPLKLAKDETQMQVNSGELVKPKFRFAWILAAVVVVLLSVVLFNMRQGPQGKPDVSSETLVAQAPVMAGTEEPVQDAEEQNSQSETAATQIVTDLQRFQDETENGGDYNEYDKKLTSLKTSLNDTLPSFSRHNPNDETFRQEVAAALREYTAAGSWWKTTITNSTVFTEADRTERTQKNFESARTHLRNAARTMAR